ncbi:MAG: acetate kinase [Lentisphaeria bacterium]|nr:acetate kinase [Lentisphaerota bacterium]MBR2632299.1 acetate kinase [Lentisphaeria bacterium]
MKILVINAGSSSMKFTLFSMENESVLAKGQFERLGSDAPNMIYKRPDGFKFEQVVPVKDHVEAFKAICAKLVDPEVGVLKDLSEINAVGHRVLHGGEKITAPVIIDENAKSIIRECFPLGPLHNPANLAGIEACEEAMPGVINVGVFDTQFHQTMAPEAYLYAIPYEYYKEHGIRKYGFHGTSHHYVTLATAKFLGKDVNDINIITCHLGNGCSMAAIENGKVVDTTMGLTPLEGLMMGTRSGDMDPAAVLRMIELGSTAKEVDTILNKKSGLLGVGGINTGDMRDMLAAAEAGNERAELAVKMFVRRVVKYIGAYHCLVGGAEAIVFTGGIGEFSVQIRKRIIDSLKALGVAICDKRNEECFGKAGVISTDDSQIKAIVMPTDEELMIAKHTMKLAAK